MNLFAHLDLTVERSTIELLAAEGLHVAHHADADGAIASALIGATLSHPPRGYCKVSTEELHLDSLVRWVRRERVENLLSFDINVWSARGALINLANAVKKSVRIVDDHLGETGAVPRKVSFVQLLPPGDRRERKDQIRPAFLFADAIALNSRSVRSGMHAFMALAGLYGEGVSHLFNLSNVNVSPDIHNSAREFGRGLTAAYLTLGSAREDDRIVQGLLTLLGESKDCSEIEAAARQASTSELGKQIKCASELVTTLVKREVEGIDGSTPWVSTNMFDVYMVDVRSRERVVNLVASEARSVLNSGIAIAVQEVPSGIALELRRARDLDAPNLADLLMRLDGSMFVSRGGHPMAAGATVVPGAIDEVLRAIRAELLIAGQ